MAVKSWRRKWVEHVARSIEIKYECRILDGYPEGKRPPGRTTRRRDYYIKM
jgi:hypothetical protein